MCGLISSIYDVINFAKISKDVFVGHADGELYVEYTESESFTLENGIISSCSRDTTQGFGLRSFIGDKVAYSYSSDLSEEALKKAVQSNLIMQKFGSFVQSNQIESSVENDKLFLYSPDNFIEQISTQNKISFLRELEACVLSKCKYIKSVTASLRGTWKAVAIHLPNGDVLEDYRPLTQLSLMVVAEKEGVLEMGSYSSGGRIDYNSVITESTKDIYATKVVNQVINKLNARNAPVGEIPVVLGNGWTGILLHEAIGHGLEADAIRKGTSIFSDKLGKQIAADGVSVIDDGTIVKRRGSINIDDEGTISKRTVLVEDGKLVNYIQDKLNSRIMGVSLTGNGRRESYRYPPIPRMTNTIMLGGRGNRDDMIKSIKNGLFAESFSDGQVDVVSGNFVFAASEAYMIEDGKITHPVKGAMLTGNGTEVLHKISAVGADMELDPGIGTCGKDGQWVPVGVGQPSILIDKITVGGTL